MIASIRLYHAPADSLMWALLSAAILRSLCRRLMVVNKGDRCGVVINGYERSCSMSLEIA